MELYKGGRGARMQGSREKEKREKKERDNEGLRRRRHRWEKEKRRNETTSSGSFFLRTDQPSLLSLSLFPPMLKGTTRRAEEED